jgi:hypothetical protein
MRWLSCALFGSILIFVIMMTLFWSPMNYDYSNLPHDQRVVVTLSSFAGRLERIEPTLRSLLSQSLRPQAIYLNIPQAVDRLQNAIPSLKYSNVSDLPLFLRQMLADYPQTQMTSDSCQLIVQFTKDYGPSTKLLPTLLNEIHPHTILITVDDDVVYHRNTVRQLVMSIIELNRARRHVEDEVVAYAPTWYCEEWWRWPIQRLMLRWFEGECRGFLGAFSGAAYFRWFFNNNFNDNEGVVDGPGGIFDYSKAPAGCRLHDDVWISGFLWRSRRVRPYLIRPSFRSVQQHRPWDKLSIHLVDRGESDYRDPCVAYFNYFK